MSIWEPKLKRAAFWHRCDECGGRIEQGWPYIAINAGMQDPFAETRKKTIVVFKYHQDCHYKRLDRADSLPPLPSTAQEHNR